MYSFSTHFVWLQASKKQVDSEVTCKPWLPMLTMLVIKDAAGWVYV